MMCVDKNWAGSYREVAYFNNSYAERPNKLALPGSRTMRSLVCDVIVLNVQPPTEDTIDYMNDIFYEEMEHVFSRYLKYHMNILLGDCSANIGREEFSVRQLEIKAYKK
jgi:hypothetical protein